MHVPVQHIRIARVSGVKNRRKKYEWKQRVQKRCVQHASGGQKECITIIQCIERITVYRSRTGRDADFGFGRVIDGEK